MVMEAIPPEMREVNKIGKFLSWLKAQPLDPEDKRAILIAWCDRNKWKLSKALVESAGIK